jgi:hypothetical protein
MILDDPRHDDANIIQSKILALSHHRRIICDFRDEAYHDAARIFEALKPLSIVGGRKIRVGGRHDGSYVMLEPPNDAGRRIAYSFGISTIAPWDLEMARRGYEIFQYDGSVDRAPDKHPLIKFHKFNITGDVSPPESEKNIAGIISDHGHQDCWNIVLQMDIEGAEWEVLEKISEEDINHFEQIIVELHWFPTDDHPELERRLEILNKLNRTHQSIHIHAPNCAKATVLQGFRVLPQVFEVAYVRRNAPCAVKNRYRFQEGAESFPGDFDTPFGPGISNIFLGSYMYQGKTEGIKFGENEILALLKKNRAPQWLIAVAAAFVPSKKYRRLLRTRFARRKTILLQRESSHGQVP